MPKKCKWSKNYAKHGFTCLTETDGTERPKCILCSKVLSNANLKPSRLKEHFDNRHGSAKSGNNLHTLKSKRTRFDQIGTLEKHGFSPIDKPLLHAFYKVAFRCARKNKPLTVVEEVGETLRNENGKIIARGRSGKTAKFSAVIE